MKTLLTLFVVLCFISPVYADQALLLTEVEQIQEKIWYLQRDIAKQETALEQYQQTIEKRLSGKNVTQEKIENQLQSLSQLLDSQQQINLKVENELQSAKEALAALTDEFYRQKQTQLKQAEKAGSLEGRLRALRDDVSANKQKSEQVVAELQQKLADTREKLAAVQQQNKGSIDQLSIYLGGAALALAVVLTTGFVFLNSKSGRSKTSRDSRTDHEL